jgi:glycosyltransferase involved in cell wall biosynthesis
MDITVVICTYNGAERVPEVLDHLHAQKQTESIDWEVIVVNNNSSDGTAKIVEQYRKEAWKRAVALQCVNEPRQGLSYARQRAIDEANGTLVAFLDDDNLPAADWVGQAVTFARSHAEAGAFGGQLIGQYEVEPPKSFGLVKGLFAINDCGKTFSYSKMGTGEFAPGAGLVVRRNVWLAEVPRQLQSSGVDGSSRANVGEDMEVQWHIHSAGWEIWHNADMIAHHKIPASRFSKEYLSGFFKGIGYSRHGKRMMRFKSWARPLVTPLFWLNDLRKLLRLRWRYRHKWRDRFVQGKALMLKCMLARPFMTDVS